MREIAILWPNREVQVFLKSYFKALGWFFDNFLWEINQEKIIMSIQISKGYAFGYYVWKY